MKIKVLIIITAIMLISCSKNDSQPAFDCTQCIFEITIETPNYTIKDFIDYNGVYSVFGIPPEIKDPCLYLDTTSNQFIRQNYTGRQCKSV